MRAEQAENYLRPVLKVLADHARLSDSFRQFVKRLLAAAALVLCAHATAFAALNGYHDVGNCSVLAGWAWDSDQPTSPVSVDVYVGSTLIATVAAGNYRADLQGAGIGDGNHGFQIPTPSALIDGQPHLVTVKFAGTSQNLNSTPKTIGCVAPGVPIPSYDGYFDVGNCSTLAGWAWDQNQPATLVSVDIYDGNTLIATVPASGFRQDLLNAGKGDGNHAFQIPLPGSLINGQVRSVTVKVAGTNFVLSNSPKSIGCTAPGVPIPAYEGYHDLTNCTAIYGWAWDQNLPSTPVSVDIYSGATLVATVLANKFRQDLLSAGKGDGNHAFELPIPAGLRDGTAHAIVVRHAGTNLNLQTTSQQLQCSPAGPRLYYIHSDHLSTPRLVANSDQVAVWRWDQSEPFGYSMPNEDPDQDNVAFTLNLRFPGQYFDRETNLNYNYFRDFDPASGRYIQSDPIGLDAGINTYLYVDGNPITYTDPDGLQSRIPRPTIPGFPASGSGGRSSGWPTGSPELDDILGNRSRSGSKSSSSSSFSEEAECEAQYDRDMKECRAYSAMTGDKYTFVACKKAAERRYSQCMSSCGKN